MWDEQTKEILGLVLKKSEYILKKLRFKVGSYDEKLWKWNAIELVLLVVYHGVSIATIGIPTPITLLLNTILVIRFIVENTRENVKVKNRAKKNKKASKNEFTSMHAMIAIGESIAVVLLTIMLMWLGLENNIGQKEFATFIILCISLFEGWKNISIGCFEAKPNAF